MIGREILNELLNKYERSGHCMPSKSSNKSITVVMGEKGYSYYQINEAENIEQVHKAVFLLAANDWVLYTWRKGYEKLLLDKVILKLEKKDEIYSFLARIPITKIADSLLLVLEGYRYKFISSWKKKFLECEITHLKKFLKPTRFLPNNAKKAQDILKVLYFCESGSALMRAISTTCFQNSKYLEKELLNYLVSIAKGFETELVAFKDAGDSETDKLSQSQVLLQIGIITYPEIFEFCGDISIELLNQTTNTKPFKHGFCLQSEHINEISYLDMSNIKRVLFIENRTNYRQRVLLKQVEGTLIIYHGGFYSPIKGRFFQKIIAFAAQNTNFEFWADIDLGGFLMFNRLKKLVPSLQPYLMDSESFNRYKAQGLQRSSVYLNKVRLAMDNDMIEDFRDVAQCVLEEKVTVEQESML